MIPMLFALLSIVATLAAGVFTGLRIARWEASIRAEVEREDETR